MQQACQATAWLQPHSDAVRGRSPQSEISMVLRAESESGARQPFGRGPSTGAFGQKRKLSDRCLISIPTTEHCCTGSGAGPYARTRRPLAFAVCVAIKSMSCGDRQSYGSRPSCFSLARIAPMLAGSVPDSMMDETNAANSGGDHP